MTLQAPAPFVPRFVLPRIPNEQFLARVRDRFLGPHLLNPGFYHFVECPFFYSESCTCRNVAREQNRLDSCASLFHREIAIDRALNALYSARIQMVPGQCLILQGTYDLTSLRHTIDTLAQSYVPGRRITFSFPIQEVGL